MFYTETSTKEIIMSEENIQQEEPPQTYALKTELYDRPTVVVYQEFPDFASGIRAAEYASSLLAALRPLTRHDSFADCVRHMDTYSDLYNEGSITLKRKTP